VSGVVYLPRRPRRRSIRSLLARLRSALKPLRRAAVAESVPRALALCRALPIATGATRCDRPAQAPGSLHLSSRRSGQQYVVELSGELTERTLHPLGEALEDALEDHSNQIVLDVSRLAAIDRAGLGTILTALMRAEAELKPFVIVPGPRAVQRVFDDAEGPFSYVPGRGGHTGAIARSRDRRAGRSARPGHSTKALHAVRRPD